MVRVWQAVVMGKLRVSLQVVCGCVCLHVCWCDGMYTFHPERNGSAYYWIINLKGRLYKF